MNSYMIKSFVKGIFSTSGALLVLGVGAIIYRTINNKQHKKTETDIPLEMCVIDEEYIKKDNDKKFKKLFTF